MVFGTPSRPALDLPASQWMHVEGGDADGHWIEREGHVVEELIQQLLAFGVGPHEIFLISPFRAVVKRLPLAARHRQRGDHRPSASVRFTTTPTRPMAYPGCAQGSRSKAFASVRSEWLTPCGGPAHAASPRRRRPHGHRARRQAPGAGQGPGHRRLEAGAPIN